jgi:glucosamine-6-phosphate deaminase
LDTTAMMLPNDPAMIQRERIPAFIFESPSEVSKHVAREIADLIRQNQKKKTKCVLGLATGSTPTGVYAELVRMHKEEKLSFKNVVTFNLDEYFPMQPHELQSYHRFMHEHLFDHIDILPKNIHIPDGTLPPEDVFNHCKAYEKAIADLGGIQLQILGIGRTGHIGFNEPGSGKNSITRLITLDKVTRLDAASDFFGDENVPRRAITMGVGTILKAKRIILMAFGEGKAPVVAKALENDPTPAVAASFLQEHPNSQFMLDAAAAANLTRMKAPWLLGPIDWNSTLTRRAVIWLAMHEKKPILKLTDEDYNEAGLQDLLAEQGPAYNINISVFRAQMDTITGWPGGKRSQSQRTSAVSRPGDNIFPKRVIIFSPHPDDDVISMGGTLIRLADQEHEVHIAYQTSGNIAVFDDDALRFADFVTEFNKMFGIATTGKSTELDDHIAKVLRNKKPGQVDSEEVQKIKALIRRTEARAGGRACGVPNERMHFLDMPFYETGRVRKNPLGEADFKLIVDLLEKVKPHQIYAAGDLSDPHGTHRVCLAAILEAVRRCQKKAWFKDSVVWLYRGAWQEWGVEEIDMAVPLSPQELMRKRAAIFKHQSQKDRALFPGSDSREFWQRAEDRNRATADLYNKLGLPEYEAIEGFVQWHDEK